ncbi:CHAP domain-containing protein [Salipiger mangrovisoli]
MQTLSDLGLDVSRQELALREVEELQSRGQRVWCVPYARNLSGIDIRGNAETWWGQAKDIYARGTQPLVGSVMAFSKTRAMPMGHVAVVSDVVSPREVRVDHANWHRNEVSLQMAVIDVSPRNDWSEVRVESNPGSFGSIYPVNGFIYPKRLY